MDAMTGAVVIVGLSQAGKPGVELVKGFLDRILGPSADVVGESLAHPIREWQRRRVERAAQVIMDAASIVEKSGKEPQHVPGRLLMPILERSSVEDNPDLQQQWAALLANAAVDEPSVLPAYPEILGCLTRLDAKVLRYLAGYGRASKQGLIQNLDPKYHTYEHDGQLLEAQYQVRMENLDRMGLIYPIMVPDERGYEGETGVIIPMSGKIQYKHVAVTALGRAFVIACSTPEHQSRYQEKS